MPAALYRYRWALWIGVLLIGAGIGAILAFSRSSGKAAEKRAPTGTGGFTWAAGERRAPNFNLVDEHGRPVSLSGLHGRPALITFMDPVCRNLCPLEAKVLGSAVRSLPAAQRPAIISVNVNRRANARHFLLHAESKWRVPSSWHWAAGKPAALAKVWNAYGIGVRYDAKTNDVNHTEATFLVDRDGYERVLFSWPFRAQAVEHAVEQIG